MNIDSFERIEDKNEHMRRILCTWIATSDGSMQSIVAIGSPVSRVRDLQQFLRHIGVVPHHRDEHGRLVVLVHGFRQAGLRVDQLQGELPVPAADRVVQRVEPALVLRQDRLAQLLVTAAPEDERGHGDVAAGHGGEQRRLAVRVHGAQKSRRGLVLRQRQDVPAEPLVAMDAGDVEAGVPLRSRAQQHPRGLQGHVLHFRGVAAHGCAQETFVDCR